MFISLKKMAADSIIIYRVRRPEKIFGRSFFYENNDDESYISEVIVTWINFVIKQMFRAIDIIIATTHWNGV